MNVLVTGADGFIGNRLVNHLLAECSRVSALLMLPVNGPWHASLCANLVEDSSIDLEALMPVDVVFHLAGKAHAVSEIGESEEYFALNTEGTRKLLIAAQKAGVRRFVYFSSVKAMGEGQLKPEDETFLCRPHGAYGQSKLAAEKLVLEGGYVPEPVVIRPTMVYGPTDKGNLPQMVKMISRGLFPPLHETGNRRSMVHVDDIVEAAILAANHPKAVGQTYIVSDGRGYSTRQLYEIILTALERRPPSWNLPLPFLKMAASVGDLIGRVRGRRFIFDSSACEKLLNSACYSSRKIETELGFKPTRNLENSIGEIIDFLASAT